MTDAGKGTPTAAGPAIPRGSRLGPYEVLGPLGAGGMGLVVRALDTRLAREVAIKILYADAARDEKRLRRLVAEARAASALNHPNIVTVFEMGESERGPYIVTEVVEGETVRSLLAEGALPLTRAIDIALQTLAGLAKAHEFGLVHRDVKPENLMVTRDGFVKILDFGLAKLTQPDPGDPRARRLRQLGAPSTEKGTILGTAAYMSPEQVRSEPVTAASDLFAVAVVLYEMVSGRNPFLRPAPEETFVAVLREGAAAIDGVPPRLAAILEKGLAKRPEDRYRSAREMQLELRALRRVLDPDSEEPTDAPGLDSTAPPIRPSQERTHDGSGTSARRIGWTVIATLLVLAAAGGAAWCRATHIRRAGDSAAVRPADAARAELPAAPARTP